MSDLISRQKVIDALWFEPSFTDPLNVLTEARDRIKDLPSVEIAEVKHGRWKPFDLTWGRSIYACTACGDAMEVPTEMGKPIYNYCPNCGAKMGISYTNHTTPYGKMNEVSE